MPPKAKQRKAAGWKAWRRSVFGPERLNSSIFKFIEVDHISEKVLRINKLLRFTVVEQHMQRVMPHVFCSVPSRMPFYMHGCDKCPEEQVMKLLQFIQLIPFEDPRIEFYLRILAVNRTIDPVTLWFEIGKSKLVGKILTVDYPDDLPVMFTSKVVNGVVDSYFWGLFSVIEEHRALEVLDHLLITSETTNFVNMFASPVSAYIILQFRDHWPRVMPWNIAACIMRRDGGNRSEVWHFLDTAATILPKLTFLCELAMFLYDIGETGLSHSLCDAIRPLPEDVDQRFIIAELVPWILSCKYIERDMFYTIQSMRGQPDFELNVWSVFRNWDGW